MLPPDLEFGGPCGRHLGSLDGDSPVELEADPGLASSVMQEEAAPPSQRPLLWHLPITEAAGRGVAGLSGCREGVEVNAAPHLPCGADTFLPQETGDGEKKADDMKYML